MRKLRRTLVIVPVLALVAAGALTHRAIEAQAPDCLHDADEAPDQRDRRSRALGFTRHVNTLQAMAARSGAYQPDERLPVTEALPPGFVLSLTADADSYAFSVQDTTDPCRFAYFSDQAGVIFRGEVIR